jgi:hypothetical protein
MSQVGGSSLYGFFSHIGQNPNEVSFGQVQYFQGDAAKKACIADGKLPPWHDVVCNQYYIRDLHKPVTLQATGNVTVLDWHGPTNRSGPSTGSAWPKPQQW